MTADIVNLRSLRKQKARTEREAQAAENRVKFGRSKAEKSLTKALNDKAERQLDGGRRETLPDDQP